MIRRQLPLILAVAWIAALFGVSSTLARPLHAAAHQPLTLDVGYATVQFDSRIEKQSWFLDCCTYDPAHTIVNPGVGIAGSWDINDHNRKAASGYLAAGASISSSRLHTFDFDPVYSCRPTCADWHSNSNSFGVRLVAPTPSIVVAVCYDPGRCFALSPVYDAVQRAYIYAGCEQAVYTPDDLAVQDIPDSNGGRGVITTIILTVTNPSTVPGPKGTVKDISVEWGLSSDVNFAPGCMPQSQFPNHEYPFAWVG